MAVLSAALCVAMLAAVSCSDDGTPEGLPPAVTTPDTRAGTINRVEADVAWSARATSSTTLPLAEPWPTPRAFRTFITGLDRPSAGLIDLAEQATDDELTTLATMVCDRVEPDMSTSELGASALATGNDMAALAPALTADELNLVFGALAGLHCPERLPLSGQRLGVVPAPAEGSETIGFRLTIADLWPDGHRLPTFLDGLSDERLTVLATDACSMADVQHTTTQFGLATINHYEAALTNGEQAQLGVSAHHELFGALVGWFCPQRLPDAD